MTIAIEQSIFSDVADFIVSQPCLDEIIAYRISDWQQQRLDDLIERNGESTLTIEERQEMEIFLIISQIMSLTKAKARLKLAHHT